MKMFNYDGGGNYELFEAMPQGSRRGSS